jgi:CRISPR system Cascade subunit CasB
MKKKQKAIYGFVSGKINQLLNNENESYVRASLAKLRRGVGKNPGALPHPWDFTIDGLPEIIKNETCEGPSYAIWAIHLAMTLFALHQQGNDYQKDPMHVPDKKAAFGRAVRLLVNARGEDTEEAIKRRFNAVITSNGSEELAYHLRNMVQILRSEGIPLNYPQIAEDIYKFHFTDLRDNIRLKWGREFYDYRKEDKKDE